MVMCCGVVLDGLYKNFSILTFYNDSQLNSEPTATKTSDTEQTRFSSVPQIEKSGMHVSG